MFIFFFFNFSKFIFCIVDANYNKTPVFDEETIRTYKYPFGEMVRELLDIHPVTFRGP